MRSLTFERGKRVTELAREWNLTESAVRNLTAEAWRRVTTEAQDIDKTREHVCTRLNVAVDQAFQERDYKGLAALANIYTIIVGAQAPKRIEGVIVGLAPTQDPRELAQRHEAIARALRAQTEDDT